jgi:hypothetical protein
MTKISRGALAVVKSSKLPRTYFAEASPSGDFHLISNLVALLALAVVLSGSFALSTQSVDAKTSDEKTSQNNSHTSGNYFVPPPPPYTPSIVPSAPGMTNAQAVTADADTAVVAKQLNPYTTKYIFTRNQSDTPQVVKPNPYLTYNRGVETKVLKNIDDIDSEISNHEKEIGKLLNLLGSK